MEIKASYDSFHDKYLIRDKDSSSTDLKIIALEISKRLMLAYKFEPSVGMVEEALLQIAHANSFNPVADYLAALKWDGKPRLERWLIDYLGAEDTELVRAFGRLALAAAARRVRHPGSKFDPIIVLEGEMGTQKSMAIEVMAGSENFSDQTILGVRDREAQELTAGIWLYEIADLAGIRRAEVEHVKAFASRTCDRARPAYGHSRIDRPRTCIFFATTNDAQYLKEVDRRFWPVRTSTIDIKALKRDRDQLWAEAAKEEHEGASTVLDPKLWGSARIEQQTREEADPWDEVLAGVVGTVEQGEERVSTTDLLTLVLGLHISKQYDTHYKRLGRCMRRLGWDGPGTVRIGNKNLKGYSRRVS
jgi:predicted P-loop ATPase